MSEYCKECDEVTIKVKGIDAAFIGLIGLALMFGVLGYWISDMYLFTELELMLVFSIGAILLISYGFASNVFRYSKLKETEE